MRFGDEARRILAAGLEPDVKKACCAAMRVASSASSLREAGGGGIEDDMSREQHGGRIGQDPEFGKIDVVIVTAIYSHKSLSPLPAGVQLFKY